MTAACTALRLRKSLEGATAAVERAPLEATPELRLAVPMEGVPPRPAVSYVTTLLRSAMEGTVRGDCDRLRG